MTILLGLLVFGLLILIHELGHYLTARRFGVQINEFSIGMGPKIFSRRSKKTGILYSLRCLPIGGYVAMEGEDGDPGTSNGAASGGAGGDTAAAEAGKTALSAAVTAVSESGDVSLPVEEERQSGEAGEEETIPLNGTPFYTKPVWQRMIITGAGAFMNLLLGAILMILFVCLSPQLGGTQVSGFFKESTMMESGLQKGDTILRVDGSRVYSANDLVYEVFTITPGEGADLLIERENGEQVTLKDVVFPVAEFEGRSFCRVDFYLSPVEKNFENVCKMSYAQMRFSVKSIWDSLIGLVTGKYGMSDLSGPVGVTEAIGEAAKEDISDMASEDRQSNHQLLYLCAMITVNLGIFNLLPIPALDGGRLLFQFIELIFRKPVPQKFETLVHFIGIVLLLLLMLLVTYKDIVKLFTG